MIEHGKINSTLREKSPVQIAEWALGQAKRPIVSTSFGPHAAATLHLVTRIKSDVPVIWIDTGWNTADTYRHADSMSRLLDLDLRVYAPDVTRARFEAIFGGTPSPDSPHRHDAFARDMKLRPFERALSDLRPDVWVTGIRREETNWRQSKDVVTNGPGSVLKVAPFFEKTEHEVESYMHLHRLPFGDPAYHDSTKTFPRRECGLHQLQCSISA